MALGTTNISVDLVNTTIGEGSNDVMALCVSTLINKWSRYKPVKGLIDSQTHPSCGFSIPFTTDYLPESALKNTVWLHEIPIGGALSPYRLGDFRGYDHAVRYTDKKFGIESISGNFLTDTTINISTSFGSTINATLASPYYMPLFKEFYFGISFYSGATFQTLTHKYSFCSTSKIGYSSGELMTLDISSFGLADRDIVMFVPFLAEYSFSGSVSTTNQYKKYSLNATAANSALVLKFAGGYPLFQYTINNYTYSKLGSYGLRINSIAYSQRFDDVPENNLYLEFWVYDNINGTGSLLFSSTGNSNSIGYFEVPALGQINIPYFDAAWGTLGTTPKSVKVRYHTYNQGNIYYYDAVYYNL